MEHKHIIKLEESYINKKGLLCIIMEYAEGNFAKLTK